MSSMNLRKGYYRVVAPARPSANEIHAIMWSQLYSVIVLGLTVAATPINQIVNDTGILSANASLDVSQIATSNISTLSDDANGRTWEWTNPLRAVIEAQLRLPKVSCYGFPPGTKLVLKSLTEAIVAVSGVKALFPDEVCFSYEKDGEFQGPKQLCRRLIAVPEERIVVPIDEYDVGSDLQSPPAEIYPFKMDFLIAYRSVRNKWSAKGVLGATAQSMHGKAAWVFILGEGRGSSAKYLRGCVFMDDSNSEAVECDEENSFVSADNSTLPLSSTQTSKT